MRSVILICKLNNESKGKHMNLTNYEKEVSAQIAPVLAERGKEYEEATKIIKDLTVVGSPSLEYAGSLLEYIKKEKKGLEEVRKSGPGALMSLGRKLSAQFKPLSDSLEKGEKHLKAQIGGYIAEQRELERKALQDAAAAHVKGDQETAKNAVLHAAEVTTSAGSDTTVREVWRVAAVDPALVPRNFMIVDEKRIASIARATPGDVAPPEIAGVVFEKTTQVIKR